ncbi:non-ribosomal peptide synthetase, partial [Streptomyces sp. SID5770]|uniref:non-ribosomal peptide synthetase n=1 Tax=Streptomyces sp. SID5770 TaxID=2690308 RepID=UPI0031BB7D00
MEGRLDHQVKVHGSRVSLTAVESAIRSSCWVKETAVVDIQSPDGSTSLVAFVVSEQNSEILQHEVRRSVIRKLPLAAVPTNVVSVQSLPLLPGGKIDRGALRLSVHADSQSHDSTHEPHPEQDPGQNQPVMEAVLDICRAVADSQEIGLNDDLLEWGVESLATLEIAARIQKTF